MIENDVAAIQGRILRILEGFDEFSKKNHLEYFILGGTLLGAVRHAGFIPWDDDIDIGLPRSDYDRLITLAKDLPTPYRLESPDIDYSFVYPFSKLYDTTTTAIEDLEKPFRRGLWIDIFPIDGTFDNRILRRIHYKSSDYIKRKIATKNKSNYKNTSFKGKSLLTKFVERCWAATPVCVLHYLLRTVVKIKNFNGSNYAGNLLGRWGPERELMETKTFHPVRKLVFCGMEVPAPSDPNTYLATLYGDYMTLPPEKKRKPEHRLLLVDFEHSYLDHWESVHADVARSS